DVGGAFDNVLKDRLLSTMKNLGISRNIVSWTNDFMSNRQVALLFNNEKDNMKSIETSISQGSLISPILFLLYLRPLFDNIKRQYSSTLCLSYIDDVSMLVSNKKVIQNTKILENLARTAFN